MITIGVTGGSGCGKTTLLAVWRRLGCASVDADGIYHRLLAEDEGLIKAIAAAFPQAVAGGVLDRKKLGGIVFADKQELLRLEGITHGVILPAIYARMDKARRQNAPAEAIDAIRLFESPLMDLCDVVVTVTAPLSQRLTRIVARDGVSEAYAKSRLAAQPDMAYYRAQADYWIENKGPTELFEQECQKLYEKIVGGPA